MLNFEPLLRPQFWLGVSFEKGMTLYCNNLEPTSHEGALYQIWFNLNK